MNELTFVDYLKRPVNGVKPYSIFTAGLICLVLGLVDTVGCVVLIISALVFVLKGHRGLGAMLALTNCIIPDALPLVDEAAGIVAVVLPLYIGWKKAQKKQGNLADAIVDTIESQQEYVATKDSYSEMDELETVKTVAQEFATKK